MKLSAIATTVLIFSAPAVADVQSAQQFMCNGGTSFTVTYDDAVADVRFSPNEVYRLRSKPSSLGRHYVSEGATLIVDGPLAAFVTSRRIDLEGCTLDEGDARPLAAGEG